MGKKEKDLVRQEIVQAGTEETGMMTENTTVLQTLRIVVIKVAAQMRLKKRSVNMKICSELLKKQKSKQKKPSETIAQYW